MRHGLAKLLFCITLDFSLIHKFNLNTDLVTNIISTRSIFLAQKILCAEVFCYKSATFVSDIRIRHSYQTFESDIPIRHSYLAFVSNIRTRHLYQTFVSDIRIRHSYQTFVSDIRIRHSYLVFVPGIIHSLFFLPAVHGIPCSKSIIFLIGDGGCPLRTGCTVNCPVPLSIRVHWTGITGYLTSAISGLLPYTTVRTNRCRKNNRNP